MWRAFAARLTNASGIAAASAGVIFFVAANWQAMGVAGRFTLLESTFAACALIALWRVPPQLVGRNATAVLVIVTGALLALFGQTYQTGADVYELFMTWALLALPFAIAGGSGAVWAIWWIILDTGLALLFGWLSPGHLFWGWLHRWGLGKTTAILIPFAVNLAGAAIVLWLGQTRFAAAAPRWLARLLLTIGFAYGTFGSLDAIFEGREFVVIAIFAAACAAVAFATLRAKTDVFPMALIAASAITVTTAALGNSMQHNDLGTFFILGTWIIGTSTAAGFLLMHWVRTWRPDEGDEGEETAVLSPSAEPVNVARRPWYISLLLGGAGWFAGLFVLLFIGTLLHAETGGALAPVGIVLIAAALGLYLAGRDGMFTSQLALALSIAGQCAAVVGIAEIFFKGSGGEHGLALVAFVLQAGLAVAMPNALHRAMSALFACVAWGLFIRFTLPAQAMAFGWAISWLPVAGALYAVARSDRVIAPPIASGLILGLAFATLASDPVELWSVTWNREPHGEWLALWPLLSAMAALGALCAAFALGRRGLMAACIVAALLHLAHFYFVLGTTLLVKSVTMIALGAVLLLVARELRRKPAP